MNHISDFSTEHHCFLYPALLIPDLALSLFPLQGPCLLVLVYTGFNQRSIGTV